MHICHICAKSLVCVSLKHCSASTVLIAKEETRQHLRQDCQMLAVARSTEWKGEASG